MNERYIIGEIAKEDCQAAAVERERQNTVAAKQRAEAKVEKLEDLVEAIDNHCGEARATIPPMRASALADLIQDLIEDHRASQRNL